MSDKLSRREFFKKSGGLAAGAGLVTGAIPNSAFAATTADAGNAVLPYPRKALGAAAQIATGQAVAFSYPDECVPLHAPQNGQAGRSWRRARPGHRRVQQLVHAHGVSSRPTTQNPHASSAPATTAPSTRRKAGRWSVDRRRRICPASSLNTTPLAEP